MRCAYPWSIPHGWACVAMQGRESGLDGLPEGISTQPDGVSICARWARIVLTLLRPSVVTRLVLRTHQAVGTAATIGHQVQVAAAPLDRLLQVTAPGFRALNVQRWRSGSARKWLSSRQCARARDSARPGPIAWRLQRFGDTGAQVLQGRRAQALHRRRGLMGRLPGQTQDSGDKDGIRLVGLGPGQDTVHRPVRQGNVDLPQGGQEVNEEAGFHGE